MKIIYTLFLSFIVSTVSYISSYVLMDMDSNRILVGNNIHNRYLTASIAKIMTSYVVIMEGNLDETVIVDNETTLIEGSRIYLEENDEISVTDLLYGLMLRSGNDAAIALAKNVGGSVDGFVYLMNEYAKIIGMKNTTFENPTGLDEETKNYSTPYDMALLMSTAYKNETFRKITGTKIYKNEDCFFINKHRLVKSGGYFTGGKTGYTEEAGRTLVTTASKDNINLVVVTFKDGDDWNTHKNLFNKGFSEYEYRYTIDKQKFSNEIEGDFLPYLDEKICFICKKNEEFSYNIVINQNDDLFIGRLDIYSGDLLILSKKLKGYSVVEMGVSVD